MADVNKYRRKANRCPCVLKEPRRDSPRIDAWRCSLVAGHQGQHESHSGHRQWIGTELVTWNAKGRALPKPEGAPLPRP